MQQPAYQLLQLNNTRKLRKSACVKWAYYLEQKKGERRAGMGMAMPTLLVRQPVVCTTMVLSLYHVMPVQPLLARGGVCLNLQ